MLNTIDKKEAVLSILVLICLIGGLFQGMLLPLLSILLESQGIPASMNGLNAASLYLGILTAAPFMEKSLYRFGFKPILIFGTLILAIQLLLFPVVQSYTAWMVLRFSMGIVTHSVFYTILTWIGLIAPEGYRGRYLSYFGFGFGIGFSSGPLVAGLRHFGLPVPFLVVSLFFLCGTGMICLLKNPPAASLAQHADKTSLAQRAKKAISLAWFALLLPFAYGFMENAIGSSLPVSLTRNLVDDADIALILSAFFLSGLVTQLPLGRMSDRLGRKTTFTIILTVGLSAFTGAAMTSPSNHSVYIIFFIIAGGALGSIYSLGVTYVADCIPKSLLAAGNMLCSSAFGLGSLLGPFAGGIYIDVLPDFNFTWLLVIFFSFILCGLLVGKPVSTSR